jgi:hypothetical protein
MYVSDSQHFAKFRYLSAYFWGSIGPNCLDSSLWLTDVSILSLGIGRGLAVQPKLAFYGLTQQTMCSRKGVLAHYAYA